MKVIILCGGVGTRLREETQYKPKALVEVGGKPLIWHIMKQFSEYGYDEFVLALGYMGWAIKDYFVKQHYINYNFELNTKTGKITSLDEDKQSYKITFVETGAETKTAGRIAQCEPYIPKKDDDFVVAYSDGISDVDFSRVYKLHRKMNVEGTLVCSHPKIKYGKVNESKGGLIDGIEEKPVVSDWVNAGFMFLKRSAFRFFRAEEMDYDTLDRIAKLKQLAIYKHTGFWYAVDTFKELEDINSLWRQNGGLWKK